MCKQIDQKSWNFVPWNFTNFASGLYQILSFLPPLKTSIEIETPHFPTFTIKRHKCKAVMRDGNGKLRNGLGKVMEKYFCQSVGALWGQLKTCQTF